MKYKLIGLTVCTKDGLSDAASAMQSVLSHLCDAEFVTYDRILYPYADSLLLAKREGYPVLFGQKSVIWDVPEKSLRRAVDAAERALGKEIEYTAVPLECCSRDIEKYLSRPDDEPETVSLGGFHKLTAATVTPWGIREHSRRFCSFCEHISRMKGIEVVSLNAGYISIKPVDANHIRELRKLYESKTGGAMLKKNPRQKATENDI